MWRTHGGRHPEGSCNIIVEISFILQMTFKHRASSADSTSCLLVASRFSLTCWSVRKYFNSCFQSGPVINWCSVRWWDETNLLWLRRDRSGLSPQGCLGAGGGVLADGRSGAEVSGGRLPITSHLHLVATSPLAAPLKSSGHDPEVVVSCRWSSSLSACSVGLGEMLSDAQCPTWQIPNYPIIISYCHQDKVAIKKARHSCINVSAERQNHLIVHVTFKRAAAPSIDEIQIEALVFVHVLLIVWSAQNSH